ncbi:MAG: 4Fe-4S binding protein [Methanocorpusculum sp.]|uniref:4Fe-4S binding protein n=1 Tax=Methanocorpusculum sp. TaxID=2058474 RepID=UPI002722173A|nr:4Fe-4S binding protein [Methanocorpusculum sp.]MDO9522482.1 4Fe-4S binding protein [Methanocorpusculum sp.]
MFPMLKEILVQSVKKPVTNLFPAARLPKTITGFLGKVSEGKAALIPPVETPENMRGKLLYDRNLCNGCGLCMKVCPAHAIEQVTYPVPPAKEGEDKPRVQKRVRIYVGNCIFCGQCIDICPKDAISQSSEFLLATEDRFAESQIIE